MLGFTRPLAAIVLVHNQRVFTRDVERFQKIRGLVVETW
jgi:predicted nucleic acid-binding protein